MTTVAQAAQATVSVIDYIRQRGDLAEWSQIPGRHRSIVEENLAAMLAIDALVNQGVSLTNARKRVAAQLGNAKGYTYSAFTRKHKAWISGDRKVNALGNKTGKFYTRHDWRYFLPAWNNGDDRAMVTNDAFCQYVGMLQGKCQRDDTGAAVRRRLIHDVWLRGEDVPGVGSLSVHCARLNLPMPARGEWIDDASDPRIPDGWSETNIRRCVERALGRRNSSKRSLIQHGEHGTLDHWGDQLLRTRAALRPGELYAVDDVDLDLYCWMVVNGIPQVVRPTCLFITDVGMGTIAQFGVAGAYTRAVAEGRASADTRRGLCAADMKLLMLSLFQERGFARNWQTHVLMENATAKLSNDDVALFERFLPVKFDTTQMIRTKLPGGFLESCGNPKQKGWIEAFFRFLHVETNHLPGAIGRRYDVTRGDTGAALCKQRANGERYQTAPAGSMLRDTIDTLKQARELALQRGCTPLEVVNRQGENDPQKLKTFLLSIDEVHALLHEWVQRINCRTDHKLEGFQRVAYCTIREGVSIPDYHPDFRRYLLEGYTGGSRMMAPAERDHLLRRGQPFDQLTPDMWRALGDARKPVTVRNGKIELSDSRHNDGLPMFFRDPDSAPILDQWNARKQALVPYLNEDASAVCLFDRDTMDHVCTALRIGRVDPLMRDSASLQRMGEVHRSKQAIREQAYDIMAPVSASHDERQQWNDNILGQHGQPGATRLGSGNPITEPAHISAVIDRANADRNKQRSRANANFGDASELLTPTTQSTPSTPSTPWDVSELL